MAWNFLVLIIRKVAKMSWQIKNLYFLSSIILLTTFNPIQAQKLKELESQYRILQDSLNFEKLVFDSLQNILNKRAEEIDSEKKKAKPDDKNIVNLMAQSASLSNQLELQQQKIQQALRKIQDYEGRLYQQYADKLDSLQAVKVSQDKENLEHIDNLILYYMERKVSVSPRLHSLSFNPKKIIQFDRQVNVQSDSLDRIIYQQYLQNALWEVESQLSKVDTLINEIEKMRQLQIKASKFMNEMTMENEVSPYAMLGEGSIRTEGERNEGTYDDRISFVNEGKNVVISQAGSYAVLLRQLNLNQNNDAISHWQSPVDSLKLNITIEEYLELLKQLAKGLSEYRIVLRQKISRLN